MMTKILVLVLILGSTLAIDSPDEKTDEVLYTANVLPSSSSGGETPVNVVSLGETRASPEIVPSSPAVYSVELPVASNLYAGVSKVSSVESVSKGKGNIEQPAAPQIPQLPQKSIPAAPQIPEAQKVQKIPKAPQSPRIPQAAQVIEVPQATQTWTVQQIPQAVQAPQAWTVQQTPHVPQIQVPQAPQALKASQIWTAPQWAQRIYLAPQNTYLSPISYSPSALTAPVASSPVHSSSYVYQAPNVIHQATPKVINSYVGYSGPQSYEYSAPQSYVYSYPNQPVVYSPTSYVYGSSYLK